MAAAAPASAPWQQAAASSARKTSDEGRSILIAVDFTEQSLGAAHWATCHLHRPGDVFHLVHVSRCVTPPTSIQHSAAGTSYDVPDPSPLNEQRHVAAVKGFIKERITRGMDAAAIPHNLHFFLELEDAPAREVVKTVVKVAKDVDASIVVVGAHNKPGGWGQAVFGLGSVADECVKQIRKPLVVFRPEPAGGASTTVEASAAATSATAVQ